MLKLKVIKGQVIVSCNGRQMLYPSIREAWEYILYQMFIALVQGKPIGYHNDTLYPVDSLLPPTVEKTVKFYDLDAQGGVLVL
jgi:hypothetical protein